MRGNDYGLKILPVNAGHMIGGTAWKITKDEEEHFVYAVDVNHKNEYHLGQGYKNVNISSSKTNSYWI